MKITEVRGFHLSFSLPEPMGNALTLFRKRDALLVQILTDSGLCGWGNRAIQLMPLGRSSVRGWPV
jgi:D-galactarolactone cycloisomerase